MSEVPGQPGPEPGPSVATATRRKHGPAFWITLGIGLGVLVLGAFGALFLIGLNSYLTHDLLDESFTTDRSEFATGSTPDYEYRVVDGAYAIQKTSDAPGPAISFANLARTAYVVNASAEVVSLTPVGTTDVILGIGCADSGVHEGYFLAVDPDGRMAAFMRISKGRTLADPLAAEQIDAGRVRSIRLDCNTAMASDRVDLIAYVNGQQVLTAHEDPGYQEYESVFLSMATTQPGVEARFDNVRAVVPE